MKRTILFSRTPGLTALALGLPVEPIGYVGGRPVYPIAGGSEDDPPNDPPKGDADDPKSDPPSAPPPYAGKSIADMTADEKAGYFENLSRQNENRLKAMLRVTGGKYGDDLQALLDERESLLGEKRTDAEKAVEEAKNATRADVLKEFGTKLAAAEFRAALAHIDGERRDQIIEGINLGNYITDNGDVDTDKVKSYAAAIAPADKDKGNQRDADYGAGHRPPRPSATGVQSGRDLHASRRKTSTSTS